MPRPVTLARLRQRCLGMADMRSLSGSENLDLEELDQLINESVSELHDIIVLRYADYFSRSWATELRPGKIDYPLPEDFYKLRSVLFSPLGLTTWCQLEPFTPSERPYLMSATGITPQYALVAGMLVVLPAPAVGDVMVQYVPQAVVLENENDAIDFSIVQGWEAYIVADVACQILTRSGRDAQVLMMRRDRLRDRIVEAASNRDVGRPYQVRDVYWGRE